MYTLGNGVEQDYAQALHWFAKAANQGSAEALYGLLQLPPPYEVLTLQQWLGMALTLLGVWLVLHNPLAKAVSR